MGVPLPVSAAPLTNQPLENCLGKSVLGPPVPQKRSRLFALVWHSHEASEQWLKNQSLPVALPFKKVRTFLKNNKDFKRKAAIFF